MSTDRRFSFAACIEVCATAADVRQLLAKTTPWLQEAGDIAWLAAVAADGSAPLIAAQAGSCPVDLEHRVAEMVDHGVLDPQAFDGFVRILGDGRVALVADREPHGLPEATFDLFDGAVRRLEAEADLRDLQARVNAAQTLAGMGDYDWHIATDRNRWSDQLYRIYGHEPQSFNASYEVFLSHIHPDDRERVQAVHQHAYETGEAYHMIERIVRPDGEVRHLSSNGEVVMDAHGAPVRMRGTCVDITEQVRAKESEEKSAARFRALVENCPDAIVVFGSNGTIVQANRNAVELLGGNPVDRSIGELVDGQAPYDGLALAARGVDQRRLTLDIVATTLSEGRDLTALFLRDAHPRLEAESAAVRLREAVLRRRQAVELNDSVVQGLTASVLALESGNHITGLEYLEATLSAARRMMTKWLEPLNGADLDPGDLVRTSASTVGGEETPMNHTTNGVEKPVREQVRIVLVEDNAEVRRLLRIKLEGSGGYEVVGEASDGEEAIDVVTKAQPAVVLLDLAMPRMDGLTALPLIRRAAPECRVIVLSGFDQDQMAERALAAGAGGYVEKGLRMDLDSAIESVLARETSAAGQ